jgi:hypothetical protein
MTPVALAYVALAEELLTAAERVAA